MQQSQTLSLYQLMDKYKLTTKDIEDLATIGRDAKEITDDFKKAKDVLVLMNQLELSVDDVKVLIECYSNISLVLSSMNVIRGRALKLSEKDFQDTFVKWFNDIIEERKQRHE